MASYLTNVKPQLHDNSFEICGGMKSDAARNFQIKFLPGLLLNGCFFIKSKNQNIAADITLLSVQWMKDLTLC